MCNTKKKESKYFCPDNNMDPGPDLEVLLRLSPVEQAAISSYLTLKIKTI